jgi:hypothetical protein
MDIKNLIDAIVSGNTERADEVFASIMDSKVDAALVGVQEYAEETFMESEEQIDELSKGTLGSYVKKASRSARINSIVGQKFDQKSSLAKNKSNKDSNAATAERFKKKAWSREDGVNKAIDRLTKEEVEVNEEQKDAE